MKWGMTQLHNWFYFTLSFSSSTPWKTSCFFPSKHVGFSHHSLFQDWIGLEPTTTLVENAWNPGFETVKIFGERLGKPRIEVVDIPMKTSCCWEKSGVFEWFRSFQPIFYQVGWGKPIGNQKKKWFDKLNDGGSRPFDGRFTRDLLWPSKLRFRTIRNLGFI